MKLSYNMIHVNFDCLKCLIAENIRWFESCFVEHQTLFWTYNLPTNSRCKMFQLDELFHHVHCSMFIVMLNKT